MVKLRPRLNIPKWKLNVYFMQISRREERRLLVLTSTIQRRLTYIHMDMDIEHSAKFTTGLAIPAESTS